MFKLIFNLLIGDPKKKLKNKIDKKYKEAIQFQRMGKIREYSQTMNEFANLEDEYDRLQNS